MATNRRFSFALQALTELQTQSPETSRSDNPVHTVPALNDVLTTLGAVPAGAIFLGIATDGLPVLLNIQDPHPGPMLITGDAGAGKTAFLQTIAQALAQTHREGDVQYGVITNYPDEWERLKGAPHQAGIFPVGHKSAPEFIDSLAAWAHSRNTSQQAMLLLVDDLESVATLHPQAVQNFRWLLLRGHARRVWPIVTLNAPRYGQVMSWLQNFRTRIFGRIANPRVAEVLGADNTSVDQLAPGIFFTMREKENWLRFWLPGLS